MPDRHTELEVKLEASGVNVNSFISWCQDRAGVWVQTDGCNGLQVGLQAYEFYGVRGYIVSDDRHLPWSRVSLPGKTVVGSDQFWRQGNHVLRHRTEKSGRPEELTVKVRRSVNSIRERTEVELLLDRDVAPGDVDRFMEACGWTRCVKLNKTSHIFKVQPAPDSPVLTVAYYTAKNVLSETLEEKSFIEVEVDKEGNHTPEQEEYSLEWFLASMRDTVPGLGPVVQDTLYEIFSGRRLRVEGE